MNTRCPPKRVPSAARFFTLCRLTVQPPQSYSVGGQRRSGQLTGKPAGALPDYRGRWYHHTGHITRLCSSAIKCNVVACYLASKAGHFHAAVAICTFLE
ncbi:UNVERIFIED_CONTAM: hypothetical protein FKN15_029252 [Acipenser sinensis]